MWDEFGYWVGDNRQIHNERCLMNDGDPNFDYWVSDIIQQIDPGANGHRSLWRSDELRAKFWKNGYVQSIVSTQPTDLGGGVNPASFTIGWPRQVFISFSKPDISMDNQSSPTSGYARWADDWSPQSGQSALFSELDPAYSAQVTEGRSFSALVYATSVWAKPIGGGQWTTKTFAFSPYSFTEAKPAP